MTRHTNRRAFKQLWRDVRVLRRVGVKASTYDRCVFANYVYGLLLLVDGYPIAPAFHTDVEPELMMIGGGDLDRCTPFARRRRAERLRHYPHHSTNYAARLP